MTAAAGQAPAPRRAALGGALRRLRERRWEAADAVVAAGVGLALIICAAVAGLGGQAREHMLAAARADAQRAADLVASQAGWMLGSSLSALELIEARLAFEPAVLEPETRAELDAALATLPAGASLGLYDPAGTVLPDGGTPALPPSIAATFYFAALANGADWIIAPQAPPPPTGTPGIVVARRLGGDIFAGVAVLALDGAVMHSLWAPLRLGDNSAVELALDNGRLVARYPAAGTPPEMASAAAAWPQIAAAPQGTYEAGPAPEGGGTRIVGFRHLPRLGVVAFAALAPDAPAAAPGDAMSAAPWLLASALALLGGALLTARLLRRSAQASRRLADAVAQNERLERELRHRAQDMLQTVAALWQMQPVPRESKAAMSRRLAVMQTALAHLSRAEDGAVVPLRDYLLALIAACRAGHDPAVRVSAELDDLAVARDAATPLGLIVDEVVTNAFRHAFEDGRAGALTVRLAPGGDGRGLLTIEDNGIGFEPERPARGSGRRLIGTLARQLGGEARFASMEGQGSRFTLRFPLAGAGRTD